MLHDALDAADAYGMRSWKDGYPIDGMAYVVKFREADQMIRAASDNMPENGRQALSLTLFPRLEAVLDLIYNPARTALLLEADELGIPAVYSESKGTAHEWLTWRRGLNEFIPHLFK